MGRRKVDGTSIGTLRVRKQWKNAHRALMKEDIWTYAIERLYDLLHIAYYAVANGTDFDERTGNPTSIKWVKQKVNCPKFTYCKQLNHTKIPECLIKYLDEEFERFKRDPSPIVLSVDKGPNSGWQVGRTLILSIEQVQTGGGHNDSPSYEQALIVRPAFSEYPILSGGKFSTRRKIK